jgi:sigma-B regulation protein RsbU (phosphoserine phosphatase)
MKILIADDDAVTARILEATLQRLGFEVITARDGAAAWATLETLSGDALPQLAVLDWMMPGMDGVEICRRLRSTPRFDLMYVVLLTSREGKEDLAVGLAAGANDYMTKPFDPIELEARIRVGERVVKLQTSLAGRVSELEEALSLVRRLQGLLPICAWCKMVRNETNYWENLDSYLISHTDISLTHGICPNCVGRMMDEPIVPMTNVVAGGAG